MSVPGGVETCRAFLMLAGPNDDEPERHDCEHSPGHRTMHGTLDGLSWSSSDAIVPVTQPVDWRTPDPRSVVVTLARDAVQSWQPLSGRNANYAASSLRTALRLAGFTATEAQARALLDAVRDYDRVNAVNYGGAEFVAHPRAEHALDAAVAAIVDPS